MPNLIEWIDSIGASGKRYDFDDPQVAKDFSPFAINKGLSQNMDTVLLANEMNKRPFLGKELQYRFLLGAVTKKKRYGKWAKAEAPANLEDIEAVSMYYSVNKERATEYLTLLSESELDSIKKYMDPGGCDMPKGKKAKQ